MIRRFLRRIFLPKTIFGKTVLITLCLFFLLYTCLILWNRISNSEASKMQTQRVENVSLNSTNNTVGQRENETTKFHPATYLRWLFPAAILVWLLWGNIGWRGNTPGSWWKKVKTFWTNHKEKVQFVAGLLICNGLLLFLWPDVYWILVKNRTFWIDTVGLTTIFLLLRRNKSGKVRLTVFGWIAIVFLALYTTCTVVIAREAILTYGQRCVTTLFGNSDHVTTDTRPVPTGNVTTERVVFPPIPQDNEVAVETDRVLTENIPGKFEQAKMLWTAYKESGFRQFDSDGKVLTNVNENGTKDLGDLQINERWLADAKRLGYDVETLEGNLKMALWIYQNHGATEWAVHEEAEKLARGHGSFELLAPAGNKWSPVVATLHGESWTTEGPIYVRLESGQVIEDDKGKKNPVFRTNSLEFRSRGSEPVKVTVLQ